MRLRGKSLTESMVSSAEAAKEEDRERLWRAETGELQGEKRQCATLMFGSNKAVKV